MPQEARPHYVITARTEESIVQQTRLQAGSAMVLAQTWKELGYTDVQVTNHTGLLITPERYRASFISPENRIGRRVR